MSWLLPKQGLLSLLLLAICTVLLSCASGPEANRKPIQSPNDDNAYRFLVLDNGLEVLLISDPDTKKAAAALDVKVGSGDNPKGRAGLAHFLEHMLFLGTDKYPDAAEYEEFVTEHGGNRNAYTSFEHTNYFFDINEAYLPEALDRFAQFFIAPKFDAQYVDREKNAVEAEYQMGLKSDGRRGLDVMQEVMNPDHPFSQFTVGSLETLEDRPGSSIRDELLAFYDKHYSANQMRLAVLGTQSLDELEALVRPMFSPIANKSFEYEEITQPIFEPADLPLLVQVQPQATMRHLEIAFPIPDHREQYRAKPLSYLGNLVGHEGEGSLLSQLKAEGLAQSLSAGSGLAWRGGALFSVGVSLTELGAENYERVLQIIFSYLDMLREQGPKEWLYDEQAQLAELGFRFREDPQPIRYVSSLVSGMHVYTPQDILRGPSLMTEYSQSMLSSLLDDLVAENAVVTFSDKLAETSRTSGFYGVPYSVRKPDAQELARWQSDDPVEGLRLPVENDFIAGDVSLVKLDAQNPQKPEVVLEEGRQKIWFQQDEKFRIPKGAIYVNFRSPGVGDSANSAASVALYAALLKDSVNEFAYPALLAGLNFDLYKHAQGLSLRIGGYDDKQLVLLQRMVEALKTSRFKEKRFQNIRDDMIRNLRNAVAARPSSQVMTDLREALLYGEWGEQALIAALETMQLQDLDQFQRAFWRDANAEVMIFGNYEKNIADEVSSMLATLLPAEPAPGIENIEVLRLAPGETIQYQVDVPHDDSVVAWYLQGANSDWSDRAATALTAQIMKSGFFQQLRTEQQLGYVVSAFSWPQRDVPGLVMVVQSPTASAGKVASAMAEFLHAVEDSLSQEQFERHKQALVGDILRPHKTLWDKAEYYWQSIAIKRFDFAGREALAEAVEGFSREQWLAYFDDVFINNPRAVQVVAPGRAKEFPAGDWQTFQEASAIKSGHETFKIQ